MSFISMESQSTFEMLKTMLSQDIYQNDKSIAILSKLVGHPDVELDSKYLKLFTPIQSFLQSQDDEIQRAARLAINIAILDYRVQYDLSMGFVVTLPSNRDLHLNNTGKDYNQLRRYISYMHLHKSLPYMNLLSSILNDSKISGLNIDLKLTKSEWKIFWSGIKDTGIKVIKFNVTNTDFANAWQPLCKGVLDSCITDFTLVFPISYSHSLFRDNPKMLPNLFQSINDDSSPIESLGLQNVDLDETNICEQVSKGIMNSKLKTLKFNQCNICKMTVNQWQILRNCLMIPSLSRFEINEGTLRWLEKDKWQFILDCINSPESNVVSVELDALGNWSIDLDTFISFCRSKLKNLSVKLNVDIFDFDFSLFCKILTETNLRSLNLQTTMIPHDKGERWREFWRSIAASPLASLRIWFCLENEDSNLEENRLLFLNGLIQSNISTLSLSTLSESIQHPNLWLDTIKNPKLKTFCLIDHEFTKDSWNLFWNVIKSTQLSCVDLKESKFSDDVKWDDVLALVKDNCGLVVKGEFFLEKAPLDVVTYVNRNDFIQQADKLAPAILDNIRQGILPGLSELNEAVFNLDKAIYLLQSETSEITVTRLAVLKKLNTDLRFFQFNDQYQNALPLEHSISQKLIQDTFFDSLPNLTDHYGRFIELNLLSEDDLKLFDEIMISVAGIKGSFGTKLTVAQRIGLLQYILLRHPQASSLAQSSTRKVTFFASSAEFSLPDLTNIGDIDKHLPVIQKLWKQISEDFKLGSIGQIIAALIPANRGDFSESSQTQKQTVRKW